MVPQHRQSSLRLVLVALVAVLALATLPATVDAKNCKAENNLSAWRHRDGMFRRFVSSDDEYKRRTGSTAAYIWKEYDNNQQVLATFDEAMRDVGQQQVVIHDRLRDVSLLLRGDLSAIKQQDEQQFQKLYGGEWLRVINCI